MPDRKQVSSLVEPDWLIETEMDAVVRSG